MVTGTIDGVPIESIDRHKVADRIIKAQPPRWIGIWSFILIIISTIIGTIALLHSYGIF